MSRQLSTYAFERGTRDLDNEAIFDYDNVVAPDEITIHDDLMPTVHAVEHD